MLSLEEIRQNLPADREYKDEEVLEIRDSLYKLAQLAFDVWLQKRNSSSSLPSTFQGQSQEPT